MMRRLLGRSPWEIAATLFVVLLDAVHWLVFVPLNDLLRELLLTPSALSVLLLLGLYFAYCVALFVIGRLEPEAGTKPATWQKALFLYPAFGFGVVLIMGATAVSGMMEQSSPLSEGWQQLAVFGALLLFFVQIGVQSVDFEAKVPVSSPLYLLLLAPALVVSELVLNLSVALWYRFLGPEGGPTPDDASTLASFVIAAPLFLIFFAAPRFTFLSRSFTWLGLGSGLALALYELWQLVDEAPLL